MNLIFIAVIVISLIGARTRIGGGYSDTCLYRKQTNAINGIFVMLVFMRHFRQYIVCGPYDSLFWSLDNYLGQLIVTTFLFYSGYGMLVSLKNKPHYLQSIPKRFFKVWLQFAVALCLFLILNMVMANHYTLSTILLSFTGWESVGNSNWYIFVILSLYFFTYVNVRLAKGNRVPSILLITVCCIAYCVIAILCDKGAWWYDTILCYPAGMIVGEYEQQIKQFLEKTSRYFISFAGCFIAFVGFYICAKLAPGLIGLVAMEFRSILFVYLIVLITMKLQIDNPILDWLGKHTFEIYILQRLPMIALNNIGLNSYLYFGISLVVTCLLAVVFKSTLSKVFDIISRIQTVLITPR